MPSLKECFPHLTNNFHNSSLARTVPPGHQFLQRKLINEEILAVYIADFNKIRTLWRKVKEISKQLAVSVINPFTPSTKLMEDGWRRDVQEKEFLFLFPPPNSSNTETYNYSVPLVEDCVIVWETESWNCKCSLHKWFSNTGVPSGPRFRNICIVHGKKRIKSKLVSFSLG